MEKKLTIIISFICCFFLFVPDVSAKDGELQQLIDQSSSNDIVTLDGKTYKGNIVIDKPLTIVGKEGTIIQGDNTANVIEIQSDDVVLEGFEVQGSGMSRDSKEEYSGIRVMGNHTELKGITVRDSYHGIVLNRIDNTKIVHMNIIGSPDKVLSEQGNGIHILRSNYVVIEDNYIENFRDGVYMEYSDSNDIKRNTLTKTRYGLHYMYSDFNSLEENNFIHNIGGAALMHSDHITLKNNDFSFNQGSRSFGLLIQTSREVEVLQNRFHLNQRGLLIEHSTGNKITGNDFFKNQIGIELWTSAISNTFSKNIFNKNTNHVLTVGGNSNNQWSDIYGNGNYWDQPMIDLDNNHLGDIPFEYTSSLGDLIEASDELAYLFLNSPAVSIYEKTNDILGNQAVMVLDENPMLMEREKDYFVPVTILLIVFSVVTFGIFRRRRNKSFM